MNIILLRCEKVPFATLLTQDRSLVPKLQSPFHITLPFSEEILLCILLQSSLNEIIPFQVVTHPHDLFASITLQLSKHVRHHLKLCSSGSFKALLLPAICSAIAICPGIALMS